MKVDYVSPDELIPYHNNAKIHTPDQVERIANSIREFGFQQPIVVDKDNVVIIGHGRLFAAKELMLDSVPVVRADNLTDDQVKALRLADNKLNESPYDFGKLESELAELSIDGFDMEQFGFINPEMDIPENLDAEEETDNRIHVKLTFPDYHSFSEYETEIKEFADHVGAVYGLMKG